MRISITAGARKHARNDNVRDVTFSYFCCDLLSVRQFDCSQSAIRVGSRRGASTTRLRAEAEPRTIHTFPPTGTFTTSGVFRTRSLISGCREQRGHSLNLTPTYKDQPNRQLRITSPKDNALVRSRNSNNPPSPATTNTYASASLHTHPKKMTTMTRIKMKTETKKATLSGASRLLSTQNGSGLCSRKVLICSVLHTRPPTIVTQTASTCMYTTTFSDMALSRSLRIW